MQAPVFDVSKVQMHVELERWTIACRDLPQAGYAWLHIKPPVMVKFVMVDLIDRVGPWSHQTHVPLDYIPELGEFVEAVSSDKLPNTSDSGVIINLENRTFSLIASAQFVLELFCVGSHRSKLVTVETSAFGTGSFRGVKNRSN